MKLQRHIIVIIRKHGRGLFQRMFFSTKMSWELNFYNKNKGENVHKKKFHCLYNHLQKDLSSKKHNIQVTLLMEGKFSTMRIIQLVKMKGPTKLLKIEHCQTSMRMMQRVKLKNQAKKLKH